MYKIYRPKRGPSIEIIKIDHKESKEQRDSRDTGDPRAYKERS